MPPSRMRVPGAICFSATSLGELKNTIESRNALSISATAIASTAETAADQNKPSPLARHRHCLPGMPVAGPPAPPVTEALPRLW